MLVVRGKDGKEGGMRWQEARQEERDDEEEEEEEGEGGMEYSESKWNVRAWVGAKRKRRDGRWNEMAGGKARRQKEGKEGGWERLQKMSAR